MSITCSNGSSREKLVIHKRDRERVIETETSSNKKLEWRKQIGNKSPQTPLVCYFLRTFASIHALWAFVKLQLCIYCPWLSLAWLCSGAVVHSPYPALNQHHLKKICNLRVAQWNRERDQKDTFRDKIGLPVKGSLSKHLYVHHEILGRPRLSRASVNAPIRKRSVTSSMGVIWLKFERQPVNKKFHTKNDKAEFDWPEPNIAVPGPQAEMPK